MFMPKMPPIPQFIMPEVKDIPEVDSPEDKAREAEAMRRAENKRMGRRSTILTTSSGLNESDEDEIAKKTLLG